MFLSIPPKLEVLQETALPVPTSQRLDADENATIATREVDPSRRFTTDHDSFPHGLVV